MRYRLFTLVLSTLFIGQNYAQKRLTDYVDPFIGTTNFSVCNPGAV